jgi:hypothetical protein
MKCTICQKEVVLVPSAQERAKKFGGKPSYYTRLFPTHSKCSLERRIAETKELIARTLTSATSRSSLQAQPR